MHPSVSNSTLATILSFVWLAGCGGAAGLEGEFHPSRRALLSQDQALEDQVEGVGADSQEVPAAEEKLGALLAPRQTFAYLINSSAMKAASPSAQVVFVDLFDSSASSIASRKAAGKKVICYFSAGSSENWRPDSRNIPAAAKGKGLDGWAGEKWLDYRASGVRAVMRARIRLAAQKGCQGIDPDNIDGHLNSSGFALKARDQLSYMSFLRVEAKAAGLLIGMKNSSETANSLEPYTDFAVVEECFKYNECGNYGAFARHGKPVFQVEYSRSSQSLCDKAARMGGSLIFANLQLTQFTVCR